MEKAQSLPCGAIIFDLEDAAARTPRNSPRASDEAVQSGKYGNRELTIRCNGLDTPWGADDIAAAGRAAPAAVVIPKVGNVEYLDQISAALGAAGARRS
ncbi:MAG: aldolase/citrate lyase family protein [Ilumatobacteraceae bacterium]